MSIQKSAKELEERIIERLGGKPIDPIELQSRLALKADKRRVELLDELKLDKVEIDTFQDMLIHLNKQFIGLIALLIEYLQLTIPKGSIAENASTSKRGNILKRVYNLFQAVHNSEDIFLKGMADQISQC